MLLGTYPESLDLPIYNEYFLISGSGANIKKSSKIKTGTSRKAQKIVRDSNALYRDAVQPEYMFNSQIRSGRTTIERKDRPRSTRTTSQSRSNAPARAGTPPQQTRGGMSRPGGGMSRGTGGSQGGGGGY